MSRQTDYRATSGYPADRVFAAMTDARCLRERLEVLGGKEAALLEHRADAESARFRLRHALDARDLPPLVRNLMAGDIVIERAETWARYQDGHYRGTADVQVRGTPASAAGAMRLLDLSAGGSELAVRTDVTVKVPLLGGPIEQSVGGQINDLLRMETEFTLDWIARNS